jgi:myo-inositol-1(or 4)-monophosphatase
MDSSLQEIAAFCRKAARIGGALALEYAQNGIAVTRKASNNLVTEADVEIERLLVAFIQQRFSGHAVLAEEEGNVHDLDAEHLWVIDPIDGTNNFAHAIPHVAISVAYAHYGKVVCGAVFDPFRAELFHAYTGGGAFLNGTLLRPSAATSIKDMIVATGFYYDRGEILEKTLTTIRALFAAGIMDIRRTGAAALDICWTACGRFEAFFEYTLAPWDFAAGMLIAKESGCRVSECTGEPLNLGKKSVFVATPELYKEIIRLL